MPNSVRSNISQSFESIGKQVAKDVISIPKSMIGLSTDTGTQEISGQGVGGTNPQQQNKAQQNTPEKIDQVSALKQKDDIERQRHLQEVRRRLDQLMNGQAPREKSIHELQEEEELEKKKLEIAKMKEEAKQLKLVSGKRPRGDLYGVKAKQFGGEKGKNVVSQ